MGNEILKGMPLRILENYHKHVKNIEANFVCIHNLQLDRRVQRFIIPLTDGDESGDSEEEIEMSDDEHSETETNEIENDENLDPDEMPMPSPNLRSPSPKKVCQFPFY